MTHTHTHAGKSVAVAKCSNTKINHRLITTHRIHVWYIYLHEWLIFIVNVSKHTVRPMDGVGKNYSLNRVPWVSTPTVLTHQPLLTRCTVEDSDDKNIQKPMGFANSQLLICKLLTPNFDKRWKTMFCLKCCVRKRCLWPISRNEKPKPTPSM